ncbi:hypothetical protein RCC89_01685 [Cytophagaceae bacterium ABcell3]|nr:hypothetical protein RCC89_01685 [Cytophagaceae bacterium ABcell3]
MIYPLKNFPVNWVDGMKISKDHFIDSDKHFTDLVRDAISTRITAHNFGLLPPIQGETDYINLKFSENGGNGAKVEMNYCNAITPGGFRIQIDTRNENSYLTCEAKNLLDNANSSETNLFNIVLVANPYQRTPKGEPSLEENPPRHPYTGVKYHLEIMNSEQVKAGELGPYFFVVGRIVNKGGMLSLDESYIPPSTSINSHPQLQNFYAECIKTFKNVHQNALSVVKKIHLKSNPSPLATNFSEVCTKVLAFIAQNNFALKNEIPEQPPIKLISLMSSLAGLVHTSLECMHPEEKEELLKYIYEWSSLSPGDLDRTLLNTINIDYDHYNIKASLTTVNACMETLISIWGKMDTLEFIGQKKENVVLSSQTIQQQAKQTVKKLNIFD